VIYTFEDRRVELRGTQHFIADNAAVIGAVILEDRCSIWFSAVLRGDNDVIHVGEGSNVQDGSVLHTDPGFPLTIGRHVTVGHMVMLHGCTIGDNTLIRIKSVILNGVKIGNNCLIGANTLITEGKQIPDKSVVLDSPGRVVRQLSEAGARLLGHAADEYVDKIRRYAQAFAREEH